jgi:uncharacterized protein (TIGR02266 family)
MGDKLRIEFRTAPSFLVAYSVSLSRGGMFVETRRKLAFGSPVDLQLAIPSGGVVELAGKVTYARTTGEEGPPGLGVETPDAAEILADLVDRLSLEYGGVSVLLLAGDSQDRTSLTRQIRAIVSTADVVSASDSKLAQAVLDDDIDLAILDADFDLEASLETARAAAEMPVPVPLVALSASERARERLASAGIRELTANPPAFSELQHAIVSALVRPRRVD